MSLVYGILSLKMVYFQGLEIILIDMPFENQPLDPSKKYLLVCKVQNLLENIKLASHNDNQWFST